MDLTLEERRAFDWDVTETVIPSSDIVTTCHGIALVGEVAQYEKPGIHYGTEILLATLDAARGTRLEDAVAPPILVSLGQIGAPLFGKAVDSPDTVYGNMNLWSVIHPYCQTPNAPYAIRALALMDFRRASSLIPHIADTKELATVFLRRYEQVGAKTLQEEIETFFEKTLSTTLLNHAIIQMNEWIKSSKKK